MNVTHGPPLDGIAVLELGEWFAGPYAGKLLGDLGASVAKVECESGDPTRRWGPFPPGSEGDPERSGMFAYLNTSKQSLTVEAPDAPAVFEGEVVELARSFDVVIVDQHFMSRLPTGFCERLREHLPRLIVCPVTPFGLDGPKAGRTAHDIVCSASSGMAYGVGDRDRPPLPFPMSQGEQQAGVAAAIGILMALLARERDDHGQIVDIATCHVLAVLHTGFFMPLFVYGGGIVGCRNGREGAIPTYPNTVLPCADGLIALNSPQIDQWIRFVELMGTPAWTRDPRYRDRRAMAQQYKPEVDALVSAWLERYTKAELHELFIENRIPSAPLLTGEDLLENSHLQARGSLVEMPLPDGGPSFRAPGPPYRFSRSTLSPRPAPARALRMDAALPGTRAQAPDRAPDARPPLDGLRVLDLGTAWAGGLAGRFLGDFGADVIKVESWTHMDGSRKGRPLLVDDAVGGDEGHWPDMQAGFHVHSRSKRSLALNLKTERGRDVFLDLVSRSDVVLHNFSPGVLERLGLAPETLIARRRGLVVAGQCVAGYTGPSRDTIGYAGAVAALSGLAQAVGYEGEAPIGMFQGLYSDVVSALTTTLAVLAALHERNSSGLGQMIDVSQWDATMALGAEVLLDASIRGEPTRPQGTRSPLMAPHGIYPCRRTDGEDPQSAWVAIAAATQLEWAGIHRVLADSGHLLPAGALDWSLEQRQDRAEEIDAAIQAWSRTRSRYEAEDELQARGVPAGAVQSIGDMFSDPQLAHRGAFVHLEHPLVGVEPMPGTAWVLKGTPGIIDRPAPNLGEHTIEILRGELGMSDDAIRELQRVGAIETGPPSARTKPGGA